MKKRIVAALLAALLAAGCLSGCGKKQSSGSAGSSGTQAASGSAAAQTSAKYVYTADYLDVALDKNNNGFSSFCASGDYAYIATQIMTDPGSGDGGAVVYGGGIANDTAPVAAATDAAASSASSAASSASSSSGVYVPPTYKTVIYRVDIKTGDAAPLDAYEPVAVPDGYQGDTYISLMLPGADGSVWISDSMSSYKYDLPDGFNAATDDQSQYYVQGEVVNRMLQFGADGKLLNTITLPQQEDGSVPSIAAVDKNGNLYASVYSNNKSSVEVLDSTGKVVKTIDLGEKGGNVIAYNGGAAVQIWDTTSTLRPIDPDSFEMGDPIELPANSGAIYATNDEAYDFLYDNNGSIYGYKIKEKTSEKVVDWLDCDVNSNEMAGYTVLSDGRVLGFLNQSNSDGSSNLELVVLTRTDSANVKPRTVLKLACMYVDWTLRSDIVAFNKASDKYRIVVEDYSQYATNDDYSAGVTKLNTEIISGKIPDLIYTANLPVSKYAAQGILEDLLPYVQKDPDLGADALVPEVLAVAENNGHLYRSYSNFFFNTAVGLDKVVGGYSSWTLADLQDAMKKLQSGATVFSVGVIKTDALRNCVSRNMSSFVDWANGTCSFDSQDFKDILTFANSFPDTFDWNNFDWNSYLGDQKSILNGTQLLADTSIGSFYDFLNQLAMYNNEPVDFVGYPTQSGNGSTLSIGEGLCITTACADKDAAWSFIRQYFTEDYQNSTQNQGYGFPSNAKSFQKQIDDMMTLTYQTDENGNTLKDENGNPIVSPKLSYYIDDTHQIVYNTMSQEQLDQFQKLFKSCKTIAGSDESIMQIVLDEAAAYFSGEKTVDDAASMIQNRVSLYVKEQS